MTATKTFPTVEMGAQDGGIETKLFVTTRLVTQPRPSLLEDKHEFAMSEVCQAISTTVISIPSSGLFAEF